MALAAAFRGRDFVFGRDLAFFTFEALGAAFRGLSFTFGGLAALRALDAAADLRAFGL